LFATIILKITALLQLHETGANDEEV